MASRQQRYIPHVLEVFEPPPQCSTNGNNHHVTGSRLFDDEVNRNSHRAAAYTDSRTQSPTTASSMDGCRVQNRTDQHYGNHGRTLTEKDVKHIERHLSMKKTIRKQLSRHLTQSCLDAETKGGNGTGNNGDAAVDGGGNESHRRHTTVSNAFAKSESNFLELLRSVRSDDDRDSGHCSPTEDAATDLMQSQWSSNFGTRHNSKNNAASAVATDSATLEPKKSSFWKKLTIRAKTKH